MDSLLVDIYLAVDLKAPCLLSVARCFKLGVCVVVRCRCRCSASVVVVVADVRCHRWLNPVVEHLVRCPVERRCSVVVVRPMLLPDCRTHTCLRGTSHHLFIIIELLIGPRLCHIKAAHSNGSTLCFVFWSEQLVCWPGGVGVLSLVSLGHERHHR